ncbi:MAG: CHASE3 domain-containing protein [Isosphaeraceae bacterium]
MSPGATRWPSSQRLLAGYALAFGLLAINAVVTFWNLRTIAENSRDVAQTHEVIVGLEGVLSNLRDAETGQRGYLLTGDERYLDPYNKAVASVDRSVARLKEVTASNGIRQNHLIGIEQAVAAKFSELEETIRLRREEGFEAALAVVKTDRGMALMRDLRDRIGKMTAHEDAMRASRQAGLRAAITRTTFTFVFVSALALTLLFAVHHLNHRSRNELRTSARWFSTTLASIGDAVIATDEAGDVSFMNPTAERLTGWTLAEAQGKPLDAIFRITNEQTSAPVECPVEKVLREGLVVGLANDTVLTARDGSVRPIDDSAAPIRDDDTGVIRGVVLVFHDVSSSRAAEQERERLYQELRETDKRKDEFLAMLAHELRNPLAAIGNAVSLSTLSGLQEHIDWSMQVISRQIRHLTRLIDDLLDVSRITRGKIELRRRVLEATPILESAVETVRPLIEERKHILEMDIDRGGLWVDADPTRLEQVVVNLLNNAAKYSENGGRIWLIAAREGDEIAITLRDRGMGIAPGKVSEMFELFAQGNRSLARSEGGLGIGLTVVRKLVALHGGSVTARSEGPGKGCEFTVRLPAARPPAGTAPAPRSPVGPPARRSSRILVVDDNVDTAKGMARLLKLLGHEVWTAHKGNEAIKLAGECAPEFVLLDIGLPEMDGYEVARRLRQEEICRHAVIVAVSGYGQEEDVARGRIVGFDHHLVKPIDHDALLVILARA